MCVSLEGQIVNQFSVESRIYMNEISRVSVVISSTLCHTWASTPGKQSSGSPVCSVCDFSLRRRYGTSGLVRDGVGAWNSQGSKY